RRQGLQGECRAVSRPTNRPVARTPRTQESTMPARGRSLPSVVLLGVLGVLAVHLAAQADDWPQWRGPNRDGISKETGLLKVWPEEGPKLAWTFKELGQGFSGPAIVGNRIYIGGTKDKTEYLFAVDSTGKKLWEAKLGPTYDFEGNSWSIGPSSTPAVDGD